MGKGFTTRVVNRFMNPGSGVSNLVFSLISLALSLYGMFFHNPILTGRVTYDYLVWASTIGSLIAGYRELRRLRDKPFYSSILVLLAGVVMVVFGRVASIYYNYTIMPGYFGGLVGDDYTIEGYAYSLLVAAGSLIIALTTLLHLAVGGVLAVKAEPSLADAYGSLLLLARGAGAFMGRHPFVTAVAVGVFAFTFRFIPELYWWPWLIGWDTPEYAAHLLDFRERLNPFTSYYWMGGLRNTPPLLVVVLAPFTFIADAWVVFKYYPSVAYGFLAGLSALLAVMVYGKGWRTGLLAGFLTTVFVLNLRISWDYQRQLLGSVLMLSAVLLLEKWGLPKRWGQSTAATLVLIGCGLSHEVTGFAGLALSLVLAYRAWRAGSGWGLASGLTGLVANALLETWYWGRPYSVVSAVGVLPPGLVPSFEQSQVVSYLVAGYGMTLPLVLTALAKHEKPYVASAVLALFIAGVSPLIAPYSSAATWYRFLIGAAPLASTLAAVGLVEAVHDRRLALAYLVIASLPGLSFAYGYNWSYDYNKSLREFPSILAPAPADFRMLETMQFFQNNSNILSNSVIIAHRDYARYIHLAIRNPDPSRLIWISWATNETICKIVESTETKEIILVSVKIPDPNTTIYECLTSIKPIDEEHPWIQVAQVNKKTEENNIVQEAD